MPSEMDRRIKWSPKLQPKLLQRLYELNATGINDDELIDDVGIRLYLRCESIILITQKSFMCPECGNKVKFENNDEIVICKNCDSKYFKSKYHESYRHKDLWQGNAGIYFFEFYKKYPSAKTFNEKLIAIDTLIHSFHIDAKFGLPNRTSGNNLIEGSLKQVVEILDKLSGIQPENDVIFKQTVDRMWKRRRGE